MTVFGGFGAAQQKAHLFRLQNSHGLMVVATDLGAIITELHTPDRHGQPGDIVLGYDTAAAYARDSMHMGAVAGRFAGRIAYGKCKIEGAQITLSQNHGPHHLHGGHSGFNKKRWRATRLAGTDHQAVQFDLSSPNGDEGYPGQLQTTVTYHLYEDNSLHIVYRATTDKSTLINLTQHSYFNLSAHGGTAVDDHMLTIPADQVLECTPDLIPTGKFLDVKDSPLDFRHSKRLEGRYDHTFILNRSPERALKTAADLIHPPSGRRMTILTDQPALQLYTADGLTTDIPGKGGAVYGPHQAVCLETQNFPDAPNHPHFPTAILKAGAVFTRQTILRFGCIS